MPSKPRIGRYRRGPVMRARPTRGTRGSNVQLSESVAQVGECASSMKSIGHEAVRPCTWRAQYNLGERASSMESIEHEGARAGTWWAPVQPRTENCLCSDDVTSVHYRILFSKSPGTSPYFIVSSSGGLRLNSRTASWR